MKLKFRPRLEGLGALILPSAMPWSAVVTVAVGTWQETAAAQNGVVTPSMPSEA